MNRTRAEETRIQAVAAVSMVATAAVAALLAGANTRLATRARAATGSALRREDATGAGAAVVATASEEADADTVAPWRRMDTFLEVGPVWMVQQTCAMRQRLLREGSTVE